MTMPRRGATGGRQFRIRSQDRERFSAAEVVLANGVRAAMRLLRTSDAEALGDFYESVPPQDYRFYRGRPLTRAHADTMAATADRPDSVVLVLVAAPAPEPSPQAPPPAHPPLAVVGGYAWYRWQDRAGRSVFGICIKPEFQHLGAGTALMTRLLEIAHEVGPPVMSLTVQKANPRALRLYRKMGFRIVREQMRPATEWFPAEPEYYLERPV
jgi:ribosomal protein S18 acetylase RimI-like enzyme